LLEDNPDNTSDHEGKDNRSTHPSQANEVEITSPERIQSQQKSRPGGRRSRGRNSRSPKTNKAGAKDPEKPKVTYAKKFKDLIELYENSKETTDDTLKNILEDLIAQVLLGMENQVSEEAVVEALQFIISQDPKLVLNPAEVAVCLLHKACQRGFSNLAELLLETEKSQKDGTSSGSLIMPLTQMPGENGLKAIQVAAAKFNNLSKNKRNRASAEGNEQTKQKIWKCVMLLVNEIGFATALNQDDGIQISDVRNLVIAEIGIHALLEDLEKQSKGLDLQNPKSPEATYAAGYAVFVLEQMVSFHTVSFNNSKVHEQWLQATEVMPTESNIRFLLDILVDSAAKPSVVHSWVLILAELCMIKSSTVNGALQVELKNDKIKTIFTDFAIWENVFECIIRLGMQLVFGLVGLFEGPHGENLYEREGQCFDAYWELFLRLGYPVLKDSLATESLNSIKVKLEQLFSMVLLALDVIDGDPEEPKRFGHLIQGYYMWTLLISEDGEAKDMISKAVEKSNVELLERKNAKRSNRRRNNPRTSFNVFKSISTSLDMPMPPQFVEKIKAIGKDSFTLLVHACPEILQKITVLTKIDGIIGIQERVEFIQSQLCHGSGFMLHVSRLMMDPKDMVECFIAQLNCLDVGELRGSFEIEFVGEPGSGVGPVREFLDIMGHVMFSPKLDVDKCTSDLSMRSLRTTFEALAVSSETDEEKVSAKEQAPHKSQQEISFWDSFPLFMLKDSKTPYIIPRSTSTDAGGKKSADSQRNQYLRTAGRIIGLSLKYSAPLGVKFPPAIWSLLLEKEISWQEYVQDDPVFLESMTKLLEETLASDLDLTFSVMETGTTSKEIDLIPNGRNIHVTEENKREYVDKMSRYMLLKGAEKELDQVRRGLTDVIPRKLLRLFTQSEIQQAVSGPDRIDLAELKATVQYEDNVSPSHPVVKHFWEVVEDFNSQQLQALLLFWSGSSFPPFSRLSDEDEDWSIALDMSEDTSRLPQATTCERALYLPHYTTREQIKEKLLMAIEFGAVGFDKV